MELELCKSEIQTKLGHMRTQSQQLTIFTGMHDEVFPLNLTLKYVRSS